MSRGPHSGGEPNFRVAIKFLVSNGLAGSLIGTGGSAIKELMEVTEARVNVSGATEVYPGTSERVVLVAGNEQQVIFAQRLIWELIAQNSKANEAGSRGATWSPRAANETPSVDTDELQVTGRITVPASAGGMLLGRSGSTIKSISEQSGARISMTGKDEAMFTQERVLTIAGDKVACSNCLALVIKKLVEDIESSQFVNRGTVYTSHVNPVFAGGVMHGGGRGGHHGGRGIGGGPRMGGRSPMQHMPGGGPMVMGAPPMAGSADAIAASTTISLGVPESLIGNILGKQGGTMREIMSLSGAKVAVSPRGEYVEGTSNRLVTISGPPHCAQTAHLFIAQKLQQPGPPRRGGPVNAGGRGHHPHQHGDGRGPDDPNIMIDPPVLVEGSEHHEPSDEALDEDAVLAEDGGDEA